MTNSYIAAMETLAPDLQTVAALPKTISAMTDIRSVWIDWMGQMTQISQALVRQNTEHHQRFVTNAMRSWMDHNARVMEITLRAAQEGFQPFVDRSSARFEAYQDGRS